MAVKLNRPCPLCNITDGKRFEIAQGIIQCLTCSFSAHVDDWNKRTVEKYLKSQNKILRGQLELTRDAYNLAQEEAYVAKGKLNALELSLK